MIDLTKGYKWIPATYSGTLLIWSPTGHENLAVTTTTTTTTIFTLAQKLQYRLKY